jgi:hypothetical protein
MSPAPCAVAQQWPAARGSRHGKRTPGAQRLAVAPTTGRYLFLLETLERRDVGSLPLEVSTVRLRPRVKVMTGGGDPGALGRRAAPCSQASHRGLWIYPVNGLGALARLRRGARPAVKQTSFPNEPDFPGTQYFDCTGFENNGMAVSFASSLDSVARANYNRQVNDRHGLGDV